MNMIGHAKSMIGKRVSDLTLFLLSLKEGYY